MIDVAHTISLNSSQKACLRELSKQFDVIPSSGVSRMQLSQDIALRFSAYRPLETLIDSIRIGFRTDGLVHISSVPTSINQNVLCAIPSSIFNLRYIQKFPLHTRVTPPDLVKSPLYSTEELPLHTDFPSAPPQSTSVYCRAPDPSSPKKGRSTFISADTLARKILDTDDTDLIDSVFDTCIGHKDYKQPHKTNKPTPILNRLINEQTNYEYTIRYNRQYIAPQYEDKISLYLDTIDKIARDNAHSYPLTLGDILIINNYRYMHGRTECTYFIKNNAEIESRKIFTVWGE